MFRGLRLLCCGLLMRIPTHQLLAEPWEPEGWGLGGGVSRVGSECYGPHLLTQTGHVSPLKAGGVLLGPWAQPAREERLGGGAGPLKPQQATSHRSWPAAPCAVASSAETTLQTGSRALLTSLLHVAGVGVLCTQGTPQPQVLSTGVVGGTRWWLVEGQPQPRG